ncbi:MAG: hypothetical protein HYU28_08315 [Actinobacteria bacterium]|nr:hypothetical protein [Actinomycetota bacterium]
MKRALPLVAGFLALSACSGGGEGDARSADTTARSDATTTSTAAAAESFLGTADLPECVQGEEGCIAAVLAEMDRRYGPLEQACDHNAPFALPSRTMTAEVAKGVDAEGRFADPGWLRRLDAVFADLYFEARDHWEDEREEDVPPVWRTAFGASDARQVAGIGDTLLGMNAHISRDLAVALSIVGLTAEDGTSHEADFRLVDDLIVAAAPAVIAGVAERFDPTMAAFDIPGLDLDETTAGAVIAAWRQESWVNAQRLVAAASEGERAEVLDEIEANAQARALVIQAATTYLPLTGAAEARDDYCASRPSS